MINSLTNEDNHQRIVEQKNGNAYIYAVATFVTKENMQYVEKKIHKHIKFG